MRTLSRMKYALSNELSRGMGFYITGLFFFLAGISSGITCSVRAGVSLGSGASLGILAALILSAAPFALMIMFSPFLTGVPGLCAVMIWQGLLFGAGPVMPMALLQMAICVPALLFMYKKSLNLSLKWCKIRKATAQMRVAAVAELFPSAFVSVTLCFLSRVPACFFGG